MYKIFLQDKQIVLSNKPIKNQQNLTIDSLIETDYRKIIEESNRNIVFYNQDLEKLWKNFKKSFQILEAAGGLVFCKDECVFIKRLGKWDLPKGKIEENETPRQSALREVEEECSLKNLEIASENPFFTYHLYPLKEKMVLKPTYWYKMTIPEKQNLKPQTEEDITEAKWLSKNQLDEVRKNTYPNILMVLDHFLQLP